MSEALQAELPTLEECRERAMSTVQQREHHGLYQFREGTKGRWLYVISGFWGGPAGYETRANMLAGNKRDKVDVPIDPKGRILIAGRWVGRSGWYH